MEVDANSMDSYPNDVPDVRALYSIAIYRFCRFLFSLLLFDKCHSQYFKLDEFLQHTCLNIVHG
jgi:hypothetical protein